ncbi:MAG: hypothetical protein KDK10_08450 [Maritimibacter sp.]|nr:hypothetical protein [Maritimibacter sp.]
MFVKLELFDWRGTPAKGYDFIPLGERYINPGHVVEISDISDGYSAITFHGGNAQSSSAYAVKMTADDLAKRLSSKR